jgi:hypothetical protein
MLEKFDPNDADAGKRMREFFTPQMVDQQIHSAIQSCWMMLPPERRSVEEVEKQLRRIVDRALKDLREDATAFGLGE